LMPTLMSSAAGAEGWSIPRPRGRRQFELMLFRKAKSGRVRLGRTWSHQSKWSVRPSPS